MGADRNVSYRNRTSSGASLDLNRARRGVVLRQCALVTGNETGTSTERLLNDAVGGASLRRSPPSPSPYDEAEYLPLVQRINKSPVTPSLGNRDAWVDAKPLLDSDDVEL